MHISTSSHSSTPSFFSNLTPKSGKDWLIVAGVVAVATAAIFVSYKAALLVGALTAVGYKAVKSSQPTSASVSPTASQSNVNQRAAAILNQKPRGHDNANPNDGTGNPTPPPKRKTLKVNRLNQFRPLRQIAPLTQNLHNSPRNLFHLHCQD